MAIQASGTATVTPAAWPPIMWNPLGTDGGVVRTTVLDGRCAGWLGARPAEHAASDAARAHASDAARNAAVGKPVAVACEAGGPPADRDRLGSRSAVLIEFLQSAPGRGGDHPHARRHRI